MTLPHRGDDSARSGLTLTYKQKPTVKTLPPLHQLFLLVLLAISHAVVSQLAITASSDTLSAMGLDDPAELRAKEIRGR